MDTPDKHWILTDIQDPTDPTEYLKLTKQECLALVESYDNAYVSPESTVAFQTYRKIYNFATKP